jgi:hypothetical protein
VPRVAVYRNSVRLLAALSRLRTVSSKRYECFLLSGRCHCHCVGDVYAWHQA